MQWIPVRRHSDGTQISSQSVLIHRNPTTYLFPRFRCHQYSNPLQCAVLTKLQCELTGKIFKGCISNFTKHAKRVNSELKGNILLTDLLPYLISPPHYLLSLSDPCNAHLIYAHLVHQIHSCLKGFALLFFTWNALPPDIQMICPSPSSLCLNAVLLVMASLATPIPLSPSFALLYSITFIDICYNIYFLLIYLAYF